MNRRCKLTLCLAVMVMSLLAPSLASKPVKGLGQVYLAPPIQPSAENGTDVVYRVMAANVDPFTGWNVEVRVDPAVLLPRAITDSGNLLVANFSASLFELTNCVNGQGLGCASEDGVGIVHSAAAAFSIRQGSAPYSGLLFTITYTAQNGSSRTSTVDIIRQAIINGQSASVISVSTTGGFYGDSPDFGVIGESAFARSTPSSTFNLSFTVESFNGYSGHVSLFADSILPALVLPTGVDLGDGSIASGKVLISADPCGQGGSYGISVLGTSDSLKHSFLTLTDLVPSGQESPDFCIQAGDRTLMVQQGGSNSSIVQLISLNGFVGNLTLSTGVFPDGPVGVLGQTRISLTADRRPLVHLNVTTGTNLSIGRYSLVVNATSGPVSRFAVVELDVIPPRPGFELDLEAPPLVSIPAGLSIGFNATLKSVNGFNGPVSLFSRVFPLDGSLAATIFPSTVTVPGGGSASCTLTIFTTTSTLLGPYEVVLGAQANSLVHGSILNVNVTSPLSPPIVSNLDWRRAVSISRALGIQTWTVGVANPNLQNDVWVDVIVSGTNKVGTRIFTADSRPTLLAAGESTSMSISTSFDSVDITSFYSFQVTIRYGLSPGLLVADGTFAKRMATSGSFLVTR